MEQMRDYDLVSFEHDVLVALGGLAADVLSGLPATVVGGIVGSQTTVASLTVNLSPGRIYQFAQSDSSQVGSIPQDSTTIVQQGYASAQTVTLVAPSSGQSQWNLIQAQFSQVDVVRTGDPNGGVIPFYNVANPSQPISASINTVRKGVCVIQVITGAAATTGSEAPPLPTGGWVPLYLIDLAGGQTQVSTGQILVTGPSIGTGVPGGYPYAPFIKGLLAAHHRGTAGQAPQINLTTEVQGVLPYANMSPVRTLVNANLTFYVNASAGIDTNNGLAPGAPFKTIQAAANAIAHNYDFNGFVPTISVANGVYINPVSFSPGLGMGGPIQLIGNIAAPQSVTIGPSVGNTILVLGGCSVNIQGFTLTNSATPLAVPVQGCCMAAANGAIISFSAIIFGACTWAHIYCNTGASINVSGTLAYSITGTAQYHVAADAAYFTASGVAITITGTISHTQFVFTADAGSARFAFGTTITLTGGTTVTCQRYFASTNGIISSNNGSATFFPGNTAGTTASGGQYT